MTQKKCAIYCRVSTDEQSTDRQEVELLAYAERQNYEVVGVFKDLVSGASTKKHQRDKVMALTRKREIDVILIHELSRWSRVTSDCVATVKEILQKGVSLDNLNGMSFNADNPESEYLLTIFAAGAQFERSKILQRVRSGVRNAQAKGKHCGRPKGTGKVHDEKLCKKIVSLRGEGYSIRQVAALAKVSTGTVQTVLKAATK